MKEFDSLGAFASHLATRAARTVVALQAGNEAIGKYVEKVAKSEFGAYQPSVGPFPAWEELAESTKDERLKLGYSENDPLLRSGDLRDTISHQANALEAVIGSTDQIMVYHEFGTSKMPPRPVLGPAAIRSKDVIERIAGVAAVSAIVDGGIAVHPSLGYDFQTKAP